MPKQNQPTKTCISCGLQKPLSAFLQISGLQGSTYGNICSTCRGSGLNKHIVLPPIDEEEGGSSSTGLKIDAKKKIQLDADKQRQAKEKKAADLKEKQHDETAVDEKTQRTEIKQDAERKHREGYIEPKKTSFLNYQRQKESTGKTADFASKHPAATQAAAIEGQQRQEAAANEEKAKSINLTDSYIDPTQTGEIKFQSAEFQKVKSWLGASAAINTQFLARKTPATATEKPVDKAASEKDPLVRYVQETWEPTSGSPGSRRR